LPTIWDSELALTFPLSSCNKTPGHCQLKFLGKQFDMKTGDKHIILSLKRQILVLITEFNTGPDLMRIAWVDTLILQLVLCLLPAVEDANNLNQFSDQWNALSSSRHAQARFR